MRRLLLRAIGILGTATAVTTAFWLLSVHSSTFNGLGGVYYVRKLLFGVLVSLGMNAHQPSDSAVLALLFCLVAIGATVVVGLVAYGQAIRRGVHLAAVPMRQTRRSAGAVRRG